MQKLTQTQPDNCWQTCIAILLGVPVCAVPDQHFLDDHEERNSYGLPLQAYLYKHHDLLYVEVERDGFPIIDLQNAPHIMIGECSRTPEKGAWHAVIGIGGRLHWDVSPERSGLTKINKYGILVPFPAELRAEWQRRVDAGDPVTACRCPSCSPINACAVAGIDAP